jgi:hypothetical protein
MGHDLPRGAWPFITDAITSIANEREPVLRVPVAQSA